MALVPKVRTCLARDETELVISDLLHYPSDYLASFHVLVSPTTTITQWRRIEENLRKCMAEYGITHVTIGPESSVLLPDADGRLKLTCSDNFVCITNDKNIRTVSVTGK